MPVAPLVRADPQRRSASAAAAGRPLDDSARLERVKVLCMAQLEVAAASGDGHLVAKLANVLATKVLTETGEDKLADVLEAIGQPEATEPQLFAVG